MRFAYCVVRNIPLQARIGITLLIAVSIVVWALIRPMDPPTVVRVGFQDADAPLGMPVGGAVDHRFLFPSAWKLAEVPLATRFDFPMGSANGALIYNAQEFMVINEERGGLHAGDDLNGIGGMNSDLGDPVFAVADGLVMYAGEPSSGWGKTVITAHRTTDGRFLHVMFTHLNRIDVTFGSLVPRGGVIGAVGTGNDNYLAHLHFEIRESTYVDIGNGYVDAALNQIDPVAALASLKNAGADELSESVLSAVMNSERRTWADLEIKNSEKLIGLPTGDADE